MIFEWFKNLFMTRKIRELIEVLADYENRIDTLNRIIEKQDHDMELLRELLK